MADEDDFETFMHKTFGIHPSETKVLHKIGSGIRAELRDALRGTPVADDIDGLLLLTRLTAEQQGKLVWYLGQGLLPEMAIELASKGELGALLDE